jgi:hypothetical protein
VIVFDTADYRAHAGICGTADLSGEYHEWRSWLDGDVYGVIVEHRTDENSWTRRDAVFGLYGWTYARQYAADLLTEAAPLTPAAI